MREQRDRWKLLIGWIVVEDSVNFGRPSIVRGLVQTSTIADRFRAGEHPDTIAQDCGTNREHVVAAIAFEAGRRWADGERAQWNAGRPVPCLCTEVDCG